MKKQEHPRDLPTKMRPERFDEIHGQDLAVSIFRGFLESDIHPYAIYISGGTGTGKGTIIHNYIKALQCENREPGSSIACGECAQCKRDPRTKGLYCDVIWVQTGKDDKTTYAQTKQALSEVDSSPRLHSTRADRHYKIVVFDEIQTLTEDTQTSIFFKSETADVVERNNVIFIFITMLEEYLELKNPVLAQALKDRTVHIRTRTPTTLDLADFVRTRFSLTDEAIVDLLAHYGHNSYRRVIRGYEKIRNIIHLGVDACADNLYLVSNSDRKLLWQHIMDDSLDLDFVERITSRVSQTQLLRDMMRDMDMSEKVGHLVPIEYYKLFMDHIHHNLDYGAYALFKLLKGEPVIDLKIFDRYEPQDGLERLSRYK